MDPKTNSMSTGIYQIKATLKGSRPPVWRRFQVPADITLRRLHLVLQTVMGWTGYHLHMFIIDGLEYGEPDEDDFAPLEDESRARLGRVVQCEKTRFAYTYDFGDGWDHSLLVEKIIPLQEGAIYPICLAGARACPPEDCGGIDGYAELLQALQNPNHERHSELRHWLGDSFDTGAFDLPEVNQALREMNLMRRR